MARMVRKQISIQERQAQLLRRFSKARGVSEAEVIRQLMEREAIGGKAYLLTPDHADWEEILCFVKNRKSSPPSRRSYQWNRQGAYDKRKNPTT